jgi:nucleotide-binding universal stress UspA family protein
MYSSIVVGTDGSPTAGEAVEHAARLATAFNVTLHIVSAYAGDREDVEPLVLAHADRLKQDGVDVRTHVQLGDPVAVLLLIAARQDADLIVVGNWAWDADDEARSIAERIVRGTHRHILVVATS